MTKGVALLAALALFPATVSAQSGVLIGLAKHTLTWTDRVSLRLPKQRDEEIVMIQWALGANVKRWTDAPGVPAMQRLPSPEILSKVMQSSCVF